MEKNYCYVLMLVILGSMSSNLMAEVKAYKIELLVFSQDLSSSEIFDQYASAIEWPRNLADMSRYRQVASEHMSLRGISAKLQRTPAYQPVMHIAWTQAVGSNRIGTAVQIQNTSGTINGYFRIQRGHYLHMITELEFSPSGGVIYHLKEKRRFKLRELHYLDHPKFGVIARISPLN